MHRILHRRVHTLQVLRNEHPNDHTTTQTATPYGGAPSESSSSQLATLLSLSTNTNGGRQAGTVQDEAATNVLLLLLWLLSHARTD